MVINVDRMRELAAVGFTLAQISKKMGLARSTIKRYSELNGIKLQRSAKGPAPGYRRESKKIDKPPPYRGPLYLGEPLNADQIAEFRRKEMAALSRRRRNY